MDPSEKSLTIIDETVVTFDDLIKIPTIQIPNALGQTIFNPTTADKQSSELENQQHSPGIIDKRSCQEIENENKENDAADNAAVKNINDNIKNKDEEKGKKILRFAEGTVDPQPKKLRRHNTPNYSVLHIPSKSKE